MPADSNPNYPLDESDFDEDDGFDPPEPEYIPANEVYADDVGVSPYGEL
jgi:hypothetical protein